MAGRRPQAARSASRPRLLVLASTFPAGDDGTPAFVADLARVEAETFDTTVLVPAVPGGPTRERRDGYRVLRYRFFPRRWEDLAHGAILENLRARPARWLQVPFLFVAGLLAVRRALRTVDPDVLHIHWIVPQGVVALIGARRVPWVVSTHGGDLYALSSGPARELKKRVLRQAAAVTVMNEEMRSVVLGFGVAEDKVSVLPMGVDIGRVASTGGRPVERLPGRIVFVGRLVEKKGVGHLLDALDGLPDDLEWAVDVVGDGPLRPELECRAARHGSRVVFHGQQPGHEVARLLRRSSIAAFPSVRARSGDQDGRPVALLEAMAAGAAVVVSDLPGLGDTVGGPGAGGLVVPSGDVAALTVALASLLADRDLRERVAAAGRARASGYSVESVGEQYSALLLRAAAPAPLLPGAGRGQR